MKYQRVIYPQGTNAFQNSFPIFFHFCPLSLKLPEKIPLVKVLPGNACSNINFSMYSDWTNCSNLFKGGSYLKWFMFPTHNFFFFKKVIAKGGFPLSWVVIENPCMWWSYFWCALYIYKLDGTRTHIMRWAIWNTRSMRDSWVIEIMEPCPWRAILAGKEELGAHRKDMGKD